MRPPRRAGSSSTGFAQERLIEELREHGNYATRHGEPDRDIAERDRASREKTRAAERQEVVKEGRAGEETADADQREPERADRLGRLERLDRPQPAQGHPARREVENEQRRGQDHAALKAAAWSQVAVRDHV